MKLLSNKLSQNALEGLSTKTSFETHGLISSVNTIKKIEDVQKEIEGKGPRSHHIIGKKKKKPRRQKSLTQSANTNVNVLIVMLV